MYKDIANKESLRKTIKSLEEKGYCVSVAENAKEALDEIKKIIPKNSSVMNGASVTLEEIGFIDYLKDGKHGWNNLHEKVLNKTLTRKEAAISDFYLGSVHAVTEDGKMLIASNTGSQLPHLVFTSQNLILVVGIQKIVSNIELAFKRLESHVIPLEDKHMMEKYGVGTNPRKILIFNSESPAMGRKINIIFVKEKLGF